MKNLFITVMISYVLVGCGGQTVDSKKRTKRVPSSLNVEAASLTCEESWENMKDYYRKVKYIENEYNLDGRTSVMSSKTLSVTDSSIRYETIFQYVDMEMAKPLKKLNTTTKTEHCDSFEKTKDSEDLEDLDKEDQGDEKIEDLGVKSISVAAGKFNAQHFKVTSEKDNSVVNNWFIRISGEIVIIKSEADGETQIELLKLVLSK